MKAHVFIASSFALAVTIAGTDASAQGAYAYGRGSISLMQHGDLVTFSNTTALLFGNGPAAFVVGIGGTLRITVNHFLIQPGIAFGVAGGFTGSSGTSLAVSPTLGLGGAIPVLYNFALSPMVRTSVTVIPTGASTLVIAPVFAELPFTIFVGSNGIIEPFIDLGALIISTNSGSTASGMFGFGYRLGVRF